MNSLKLLLRKYHSFFYLDATCRLFLGQAFLLLPFVVICLKFYGLKRTQTTLAQLLPAPKVPLQNEELRPKIWKITRMVELAAKYCKPWANCLKRSLVLWSLLRHQGIESELRIGVKREAGKFEAHAWVEWEGIVLNDTQDVRERFAMFERAIEVNLPS